MSEHKHATVLRAIADGVPLSEFEVAMENGSTWTPIIHGIFLVEPEQYRLRRKPQYIMVNGFKVPKPLDVIDDGNEYFIPKASNYELYDELAAYTRSTTEMHLQRGIAHSTKEAAIAHAKAMLGIDPEAL